MRPMIQLTRLNRIPMVLNSDLIKTAESSPDTVLTLINGEKLIVLESCDEVMDRVVDYRARLLTRVVQRLQPGVELQRAASISSLDFNPEDKGQTRDRR
jgi:flagellar protein FlbD